MNMTWTTFVTYSLEYCDSFAREWKTWTIKETTATIIITSSFERIVSSVSHFINRILAASARERISSTPYTLPFILIPVTGERYSSILWLVLYFFTVYLFLYTSIFIYLFRSFYCHYNLYALVRLLCCWNNVSPFRFRLRLYHLKFRFIFVLFCLFKCECVCTSISFFLFFFSLSVDTNQETKNHRNENRFFFG